MAAPTLDPAERARFERAARYSAEHDGHVLLVARSAGVVFSVGQNGFDADDPHPLRGASESFWGLLAVAADADGLLDLDEPVAHTLPEFAANPRRSDVRLRQLLNGTSGLERGTQALDPRTAPDLFARAIELEALSTPGDRFRYGAGQIYVFGAVLDRKFADRYDDPLDFLDDRILERIDLEVADWRRDEAGHPDVATGATLRAAEWAKLGLLLANRGSFGGREVIPAEAMEAVFEGSAAAPEYGLTLWLNHGRDGAGPFYADGLPDLAFAAGAGNQRLYVIPSRDLVVVRFGERNRHWSDQEFLAALLEGGGEPAAGR